MTINQRATAELQLKQLKLTCNAINCLDFWTERLKLYVKNLIIQLQVTFIINQESGLYGKISGWDIAVLTEHYGAQYHKAKNFP